MDVSGSGAEGGADIQSGSDVQLGSTFLAESDEAPTDPVCGECADIDQCVVADGYCIVCQEHLCKACMRHHRRSKSSRDHPILEGKDMPQHNPQDSDEEKCPDHPGARLTLYCPTDGAVGCASCFTEGHKKCAKFVFISKMYKKVNLSDEYTQLDKLQTGVSQKLKEHMNLVKSYRLVNQNCCDQSNKDFGALKDDVEKRLYMEEVKLSEDSKNMKEINKIKLDSLSRALAKIDQDSKSISSKFNLHQIKQDEKHFIATKMAKKQLKENGQKLDQINKDIFIPRYKFEKGLVAKKVLDDKADIGKLRKWSSGVTCTGKIKVKSPDDKEDCTITDIVKVSSFDIIVADYLNKCLKQINVVNGTIGHRRSLASIPWSITNIPGSRVAVTLDLLHQIQFFTTDGTLTPCGTVSVDGQCLGIACTEDRLVVSYKNPGKLQIMDLDGRIFNTFTLSQLFEDPSYLRLSPDHSAIYVSDVERNTVTCLGLDGTVNWTYQAEDLRGARGVAVGADCCLYVCSEDVNALHVLSSAGDRLETFPMKQYTAFPRALYYCREEGALYVSCWCADQEYGNFVRRLTFEYM